MANHSPRVYPLRERLLSNSPDPMKSSILRESGMGWSSPPSGPRSPDTDVNGRSLLSPLRIAKQRDSPLRPPPGDVARRSSSSFKHVRSNNLVSKSPFKSQIPTSSSIAPRGTPIAFPMSPSRRVSGEKRPRPQSMTEQAESENDRPLALKRERKQSKAFQGLIEKEPVTKSPFRQPLETIDTRGPIPHPPTFKKTTPAFPPTPSRIPITVAGGISPTRSSLVSKRLHGPRLSGRRERRKTVTFDERCDVVEFDREEESEHALESGSDLEDEYGHDEQAHDQDGDDPFFQGPAEAERHQQAPDDSYESIQLSESGDAPMEFDPDASITGIVNRMLNASRTITPPPHDNTDIPTDLDTEEGVPFGRSHHFERALEHHQQESRHDHSFDLQSTTHHSPDPPTTPTHRTPASSPPLGRTTHVERLKAARLEEQEQEQDVEMLPESPSPVKARRHSYFEGEGLVPKFNLPMDTPIIPDSAGGPDPFELPHLRDEPAPAELATQDNSLGPSDFGEPEPGLDSRDASFQSAQDLEPNTPEQVIPPTRAPLPATPDQPPYVSPPTAHASSPIPRPSPSPALGSSQSFGSPAGGRPRINREDVQRRLIRQRSYDSPNLEEIRYQDARRSPSPVQLLDEPLPSPTEVEYHHEQEVEVEVEEDLDNDTISVMTSVTDYSVQTTQSTEPKEFGLLPAPGGGNTRLSFNLGSKFGMGGLDMGDMDGGDRKVASRTVTDMGSRETYVSGGMRMEVAPVDVDMDMRSALDRLMDDVAGGKMEDVSMVTEEGDESFDESRQDHNEPRVMERAATDSALVVNRPGSASNHRVVSGGSVASIPPPLPPKDNIRSREALIIEKRREARRIEEEESDEFYGGASKANTNLAVSNGRPSRRRSMSTGDAEDLVARRRGTELRGPKGSLMDIGPAAAGEEDPLTDLIEKELRKREEPSQKSRYHVRQHESTIYASSDADRVSHLAGPGDVNSGKAWRTVRRPSDMNEYSKQIKEYRAQDKSGKAYGKVFVKVLGVKGIHLPLPQQPTVVTCTLNNGIHFVTTPDCQFGKDCRIEQEFELIEHSKLEFTLTLKIRRDPHIVAQFKSMAAPAPSVPAPPPVVAQTSSKGGMRSFFSSSPKKSHKDKMVKPAPPPPPSVQPPQRLHENLARYLKPDGTLARAFISFKDIAQRCDTRLFETTYPLIGQRAEQGGKFSTLQVGEIVLQMFRLPPLPGIAPDQLPQSLEECHRGLRHINWHKVTYFEGTLTQSGGDCRSWRRRQLRVIGSNLVAFNDVTKRVTATIDLKKAVAIEDNQEPRNNALSPASAMTSSSSRYGDDYDGLYGVERSFRLIFPEDEINFFADTDEEKARWLEVLRALVGHIPPHPLWAELLWQRHEEASKRPPMTTHMSTQSQLRSSTASQHPRSPG